MKTHTNRIWANLVSILAVFSILLWNTESAYSLRQQATTGSTVEQKLKGELSEQAKWNITSKIDDLVKKVYEVYDDLSPRIVIDKGSGLFDETTEFANYEDGVFVEEGKRISAVVLVDGKILLKNLGAVNALNAFSKKYSNVKLIVYADSDNKFNALKSLGVVEGSLLLKEHLSTTLGNLSNIKDLTGKNISLKNIAVAITPTKEIIFEERQITQINITGDGYSSFEILLARAMASWTTKKFFVSYEARDAKYFEKHPAEISYLNEANRRFNNFLNSLFIGSLAYPTIFPYPKKMIEIPRITVDKAEATVYELVIEVPVMDASKMELRQLDAYMEYEELVAAI